VCQHLPINQFLHCHVVCWAAHTFQNHFQKQNVKKPTSTNQSCENPICKIKNLKSEFGTYIFKSQIEKQTFEIQILNISFLVTKMNSLPKLKKITIATNMKKNIYWH
jgi:hypothetical protein